MYRGNGTSAPRPGRLCSLVMATVCGGAAASLATFALWSRLLEALQLPMMIARALPLP